MTDPDASNNPMKALGQNWQVPVFLASLIMLLLGWVLAMPSSEPFDAGKRLDEARALLQAGRHKEAADELNLLQQHKEELAAKDLVGAYHVLRGDAAYLKGQVGGGHEPLLQAPSVVEQYNLARETGRTLTPGRRVRYVETLLLLGRLDGALASIDTFEFDNAADRHRLMRTVIERLQIDPARQSQAMDLLDAFLADEKLGRSHEIWAAAQVAERMLADDRPLSMIDFLLPLYGRLHLDGEQDLGSLMVLLGQANVAAGELAKAERWLMRIFEHLGKNDPLNGAALVGLGRIRLAENNVVGALEYFDDAAHRFPATRWHLQAMVGKAECEARMGALAESLEDYAQAVQLIHEAPANTVRGDIAYLSESLTSQREW